MFTLIGLGVGVAWGYSLIAAAAPVAVPIESCAWRTARCQVYFEAAAVITALVLLGQVLELRARSSTNAGASGCCSGLAPKTARLVRDDGTEDDVPLDQVQHRDLSAGSPRREGARGRRRGRRQQHGGRVDGHR